MEKCGRKKGWKKCIGRREEGRDRKWEKCGRKKEG